ncbi:hypothetical protein HUX88_29880 [Duganella sp. BJB1802]|uniref:hypothetical protein n=1 Tax=Duganella sp. BJB1802 TaxID=2744575 RepID=UPI0015936B70|nr:hypothetical protein [Duganella sp. BJB1802]NVD74699.1 hypothetical protein [Duganella sp. BJB1802]
MGPHRVNIINLLNLIASSSDQIEYQQVAPVNVANELVNQWFDDFYHPTDEQFVCEFSAGEIVQLAKFDAYYDERVVTLPDSLEKLLIAPAWVVVMACAGDVLDTGH